MAEGREFRFDCCFEMIKIQGLSGPELRTARPSAK